MQACAYHRWMTAQSATRYMGINSHTRGSVLMVEANSRFIGTSPREGALLSMISWKKSFLSRSVGRGSCWYFVTSSLDTRLLDLSPVMAPEMLVTFLRAITKNEAIHEPWIVPQAHGITGVAYYPRVFRDVIYISAGKAATKLCRQVNELIAMEYSIA